MSLVSQASETTMRHPTGTFKASEEFKPRGKWTSLPESGLRVHLSCPKCNHRYPVVHERCGMHVEISNALPPNAICTACHGSGYSPCLPADIADCPKCGQQCRSVEQVVGSDSVERFRQRSPGTASPRRRPPRIKGRCSVCGSAYGIHTHHVDWNHDNNEKSNLTTLCQHCHEQVHKLGKPLFDQLRQRTRTDQEVRERLQTTSLARHRELYGSVPEVRQLSLFE